MINLIPNRILIYYHTKLSSSLISLTRNRDSCWIWRRLFKLCRWHPFWSQVQCQNVTSCMRRPIPCEATVRTLMHYISPSQSWATTLLFDDCYLFKSHDTYFTADAGYNWIRTISLWKPLFLFFSFVNLLAFENTSWKTSIKHRYWIYILLKVCIVFLGI